MIGVVGIRCYDFWVDHVSFIYILFVAEKWCVKLDFFSSSFVSREFQTNISHPPPSHYLVCFLCEWFR